MSTLDLAIIGNCCISSLLTREGRHLWFCFPRLDGEPIFNALLGGIDCETGFFDVVLRDQTGCEQRYLDNSAVVETILTDAGGGVARIVDFAPRYERFGRSYRPPMIVRTIEPIAGHPRITVRVRPSFGYGAQRPESSLGSNHIRYTADDLVVRLTTDIPLWYVMREAEFGLHRRVTLFLGEDEPLPEQPDTLAQSALHETRAYWEGWVRDLNVPFDWQDAVIRAAITLKLCSFEDTGAILAAMTTSVPEAAATERNWDYRFCWLRDASFTVNALNRLSDTRTMEGFVRFILDAVSRESGDAIAPLFPAVPGGETAERTITTLPGYRGFGPVRIGNAAADQQQNDIYGSVILTAIQMFWDRRLAQRGDVSLYRQLCRFGREAERVALLPDAGLWEFRGRGRIHTFSAAMCWAALDRLGRIARHLGLEDESDQWSSRAALVKAEILRRATVADGGWLSGVLDAAVADASSLVLADLGLVEPGDDCFVKTVEMAGDRLLRGDFLMRYIDQDDFGLPENAFLLCTFWYIDALGRIGRADEARALFETVLGHRNHVGLLSEDIDPKTGELWGNFPQTYSQVGLILSAMRLSRSWEEGLWRASQPPHGDPRPDG